MTTDDTDGAAEKPRASVGDDVAVHLSYVDKLFAGLQSSQRAVGRHIRLQAVLSILLIALVTGLVSTDESFEISGIKLELPLWIVLGGGAVAVAVSIAMMAITWNHADSIEEQILGLYTTQGYDVPSRLHARGISLRSGFADAVTVAFRPDAPGISARDFFGLAIALCVVTAAVLLPIAAQVAVIIKLGGDFDWTWRVWLPLGAALLVSVASALWSMTS